VFAAQRLALIAAAAALLIVPTVAFAGGTAGGAQRAAADAVTQEAREEGRPHYYQTSVHCRLIAPSRFGCSFRLTVREGPYTGYAGPHGRVTVTYSHRHYYVGEPRYERAGYLGPVPKVE
jgi:hypothetical protein